MTTPTDSTPEIGWMVTTPDGDVVQSGPTVVVEMVALMGEPNQE